MLDKKIIRALTEQIQSEFVASIDYLAMSCWCERANLPGFAAWLRKQSNDEREHGLKIVDYINSQNEKTEIWSIPASEFSFVTVLDVMRQVKKQEVEITSRVFDILNMACDKKDHQTREFMDWFSKEQVEEEKVAYAWVARLELAGDNSAAILFLDSEAGKT